MTKGTPLLALRLALIALLMALVVRPPTWAAWTGPILEIAPESDFAATPSDLSRGAMLVRRSTEPPTAAELDRIALTGARLLAARPTDLTMLDVKRPEHPRVGRAVQIAWGLRGQPGQTGTVRLSDSTGPLDSAVVTIAEDGGVAGAFRVQPARPGWEDWTVAWDTITARAGAWVLPSRPLRALVVSPAGSVEGRDVARALEAAGTQVTLAQPLGRGLALGDAPTGLPATVERLTDYSVVMVLATGLSAAQVAMLRSFAESGGGVLAGGRSAAALPFVRPGSTPVPPGGTTPTSSASAPQLASAADIQWATPPEIPALPSADAQVTVSPIMVASPAVAVAASVEALSNAPTSASNPGTPLLALAQVGRGRMAALAIEDTWVWGLQAGRGPELSAFWRGMAEWLDGGARSPFAITVEPERASPGARVEIHVGRLDETTPLPEALDLLRPDGSRESLALARSGGVGHATFVTDQEGVFAVALPSSPATLSEPAATHLAQVAAPAPSDAWARLALLAAESGGDLVPEPELERRIADLTPFRFRTPPIAWLALALVLALAEWTARRLRGMP